MALIPLSQARDSALGGGGFDVRGWEVRTELDNEKVGKVDDMLLDDHGRPRYLNVDLGLFKKHVLMPIGQARADDARDVVWVPGMTKDQFEDIPEYDHDLARVDRDYERRLGDAYAGSHRAARDDDRDAESLPRLASLDDLDDFRIAEGEPNPKGWEVITADGRAIGEVDELIVDTAAMKVRYLDVDLDSKKLELGDRERHVLIPIGYARLDRDDKHVVVDSVSSADLLDLPVYGGLPLPRDYEQQLHERFQHRTRSDDLYSSPRYDAERFYARRRQGGSMDAPGRTAAADPGATARDVDTHAAAPARHGDAGGTLGDAPATGHADRAASVPLRAGEDQDVVIRIRGDEITVEKRRVE